MLKNKNKKDTLVLIRLLDGYSHYESLIFTDVAGILVDLPTGAGGPLLPQGGELILGLMADYCTNMNCTEH